MKLLRLHFTCAMLVLSLVGAAQAQPASEKVDPVELIKKVSGSDGETLKGFLADQGTASVSAAALAGVGTTPLTVVEDSKDFAVMLSPFSKDGRGGGFVISPAKVRNPLPRIDLMTQYVKHVGWRILAGVNISGAQGNSEVDGQDYRRRAFALATSAYFDADDDPIYQRASASLRQADEGGKKGVAVPDSCLAKFFTDIDTAQAEAKDKAASAGAAASATAQGDAGPGLETGLQGDLLQTAATATYKTCVEKVYANARNKWFAPRWSLAYGTGDAQPAAGGSSVRTGDVLALGVTYGGPLQKGKAGAAAGGAETILSGWAVTLAARSTRKEAVLGSLATGSVQRQNSSLLVGRLAIGTESWRLMAEASNNKLKQALAGERTMKHALGVDYRFRKDSWLVLRYGKRVKTTGAGDEAAALLSLTLGGDLLTF